MPSTYSNLKIQLMATGENNTTWGDVTNTNLGTAIEEAIVGSADVTFASNNVTLSLSNTNATQTARNLRLNLTGTTGGSPRNLVVPAIEKPYIVYNGCGDTVTVKTAAGTGIAVPAGKTTWVYCDATNVVDVVTKLTDLTVTGTFNADVNVSNITTGVLSVSHGGTGASTLTGVVKGTGTSALTAGSVALTSEVSGTLPVGNGGTGAATLTSNAVLIGNGTSAISSVSPGTSGNVLTSNGSAWVSAVPRSWTQIATVTTSAGDPFITFSSVPATYSNLLLIMSNLALDSGSSESLIFRYNSSGGVEQARSIGTITTSGFPGTVMLTGYLFGLGPLTYAFGNGLPGVATAFQTSNGGAVNAVRLAPSAGGGVNFAAGGVATLYGM